MRITRYLERLSVWVCELLLGIIVISVFIDVVLRYCFGKGFLASGEFVPYLFTWISFIGASIAVKEKEHLVVDVVLNAIRGRARKFLEATIRIAELIFFTILTYYGWQMTLQTMVQRTPYLQLPYGLVYLGVPVAGVLMCIYTVEILIVSIGRSNHRADDGTLGSKA